MQVFQYEQASPARTASTSGRSAVGHAACTARPQRTVTPASLADPQASVTRRDFPTPASPSNSTALPAP